MGKNISVSTVQFLKDGWKAYDNEHDSLLSFVQRKMNMEDEDNFKGLWERVGTTSVFVLVDSFMFQVILVALNWIK